MHLFTTLAISLFPALAFGQNQRDLVGTWFTPTEDGGIAYITFLDDGTYHHTEDGTADDSGHPGLEVGTYTWNLTQVP
jgi:hypothetical protein